MAATKPKPLASSLPSPSPRRSSQGRSAKDEAPPRRAAPEPVREPPLAELEFPGCVAVPMTAEQHPLWEGPSIELWDSATETAWVLRDHPSWEHEKPVGILPELVGLIAAVRGLPIRCYGSSGLIWSGAADPPGRVPHADHVVYLDPYRVEPYGEHGVLIGPRNPPDVVLEVDHTTDVRRGKLRLYEAFGVPEVWVETPDRPAPSRPAALKAGLTIYLLQGRAYQPVPESPAFLGWRAEDIHRALTEPARSAHTSAVLETLGRRLGERDGGTPDDDPLLRSLRRETLVQGWAGGKAEGRAKGLLEGREEGRAEGRAEGLAVAVLQILRSRGIEVSEGFPSNAPEFAQAPEAAVVQAALACADEGDFRTRLQAP